MEVTNAGSMLLDVELPRTGAITASVQQHLSPRLQAISPGDTRRAALELQPRAAAVQAAIKAAADKVSPTLVNLPALSFTTNSITEPSVQLPVQLQITRPCLQHPPSISKADSSARLTPGGQAVKLGGLKVRCDEL